MGWTAPRTWSTSESVTATIMNLHVRDNMNALVPKTVALTNADSPYTVTETEQFVLFVCDTTGGSITINLPAVAGATGQQIAAKKVNASNTLTLDGNASETIDGATTKAKTALYAYMEVLAGPSEWHVTGEAG